jgi:hypothetical protein
MASADARPMAVAGGRHSMVHKALAAVASAWAVTVMPGAIMPPRYSPSADTASTTVAVPRLMGMTGTPTRSAAATAIIKRSGPRVAGVAYLFTSGVGVSPVMMVSARSPAAIVQRGNSSGTTEHRPICRFSGRRCRVNAAEVNSSAVASFLVGIVQTRCKAPKANRPNFDRVFP